MTKNNRCTFRQGIPRDQTAFQISTLLNIIKGFTVFIFYFFIIPS